MRTAGRRWVGAGITLLALAGVVGPNHAREEATDKKKPEISKKEAAALRTKALALNTITGADPMRGELAALSKDGAGTRKLLIVARKMLKERPVPLNRNTTYILALLAEDQKDTDGAIAFYKVNAIQSLKMLSEHGLAQAYVGMIRVYADAKRFADSERVCKEFLSIEGEESIEEFKPLVIRRMILLMAKQGSTDKAIELADKILKANPNNWLTRATKAEVYREAGKLADAAATYLDIIKRVEKDKRLSKEERGVFADEYRYVLSGVYVEMNDVNKAAGQLKALLEKHPDNPTFLNDLGYIWADRGMNLAESEKMIRKAITLDRKNRKKENPALKPEEDKDNPAYLDSLGWVLHKQGKSKKPKPTPPKPAKEREGRSIEVYDHLADVHLALGEKDKALAVWKKAVESAGKSKREQRRKAEIQKKLKKYDAKEKKQASRDDD